MSACSFLRRTTSYLPICVWKRATETCTEFSCLGHTRLLKHTAELCKARNMNSWLAQRKRTTLDNLTFSDTMPPSPSAITAELNTRIAEFMRARSMAFRTCFGVGRQHSHGALSKHVFRNISHVFLQPYVQTLWTPRQPRIRSMVSNNSVSRFNFRQREYTIAQHARDSQFGRWRRRGTSCASRCTAGTPPGLCKHDRQTIRTAPHANQHVST